MKIWKTTLITIGAVALTLSTIALMDKPRSIYTDKPKEKNPFEGKNVRFIRDEKDSVNADGERGHLEEVMSESNSSNRHRVSFYQRSIKRRLDILCSFFGLVCLFPLLMLISIAIILDDPGPVLFSQKRVGKNKRYFKLHKFRSMKMSTPRDVPTHMLEDPQQYITRVGRWLRKLSLDELPQLWDIFIGNMSIVGPRPALWNQDVLVAERDRYGANDVMPGLTGLAQINGRDELALNEKARIDGEYCKKITFRKDLACVLMTVANVLKSKGIIEGGTGALEKLSK